MVRSMVGGERGLTGERAWVEGATLEDGDGLVLAWSAHRICSSSLGWSFCSCWWDNGLLSFLGS